MENCVHNRYDHQGASGGSKKAMTGEIKCYICPKILPQSPAPSIISNNTPCQSVTTESLPVTTQPTKTYSAVRGDCRQAGRRTLKMVLLGHSVPPPEPEPAQRGELTETNTRHIKTHQSMQTMTVGKGVNPPKFPQSPALSIISI